MAGKPPKTEVLGIRLTADIASRWRSEASAARMGISQYVLELAKEGHAARIQAAASPPVGAAPRGVNLGTGAIGDAAGLGASGLADLLPPPDPDELRAIALDAAAAPTAGDHDDVPFAALDVLAPVVPPAVVLRSGVLSPDERRALKPTIRVAPVLAEPVKLVASLMPGPAPTSFPRTIGGPGGSFDRLKRTFGPK